ncbi:Transposase [Agrobacterium tumefaciens]|nr:Transposase [Agrobacterium tumefaciens]
MGSFEAVEFAVLEWVVWLNHRQLLEPPGNIPPAEAEERDYAMLDETAGRIPKTQQPPANQVRFNPYPKEALLMMPETSNPSR